MKIIVINLLIGFSNLIALATEQTANTHVSNLTLENLSEKSELMVEIPKKRKIEVIGDLRVRGQSELIEGADQQWSQKLRLRFGAKFNVTPDLNSEIRLATSKSNVSTNQSIGDNKEPGSQRRFLGLDLAYARWIPVKEVELLGGRIKQIHERPGESQVILDSDLALEGIATRIEKAFLGFSLNTNWGSAWIRENYDSFYSEELTDNMINWGQASVKHDWNRGNIKIGFGFFNFTGVQGMRFSDLTLGGTGKGNTDAGDGSYKNTYIPRQVFLESEFDFEFMKLKGFYERIANTESTNDHDAHYLGFQISASKTSIKLARLEVQSDSVVGSFSDSDFAGGYTASKGWISTIQYQMSKAVGLSFTHLRASRVEATGSGAVQELSYDRSHLDFSCSF